LIVKKEIIRVDVTSYFHLKKKAINNFLHLLRNNIDVSLTGAKYICSTRSIFYYDFFPD